MTYENCIFAKKQMIRYGKKEPAIANRLNILRNKRSFTRSLSRFFPFVNYRLAALVGSVAPNDCPVRPYDLHCSG